MPEIQFEDTRMDTLMIVSTPKAAIDPDDYVDASEIRRIRGIKIKRYENRNHCSNGQGASAVEAGV